MLYAALLRFDFEPLSPPPSHLPASGDVDHPRFARWPVRHLVSISAILLMGLFTDTLRSNDHLLRITLQNHGDSQPYSGTEQQAAAAR